MKNLKINGYKAFLIILSGFVLVTATSCTKKTIESNDYGNNGVYEELDNTTDSNDSIDKNTANSGNTSDNNSANLTVSTNKQENNNVQEKATTVTKETNEKYTENDKSVINYFNDVESKVDAALKNDTTKNAKNKLKGTFISIVDFIFYDSEVNGIKFSDLTDEAKQNVLSTINTIDSKICAKYPNYKEEISDKTSNAYDKASEIIKKGAIKISDFSKEKLGDNNYNSIISDKDELVKYTSNAVDMVGELAGNILGKGKSKIKTWYENYRN